MHPYDIFLIVSVACVIGFTGVIYVENDLKLALGFVASAVIGCPLGAWAFWRFVPIQDQFAVIAGAFVGGLVLSGVNVVWWRR
ncbi:hypothetical protein LCL97_13850 [Seohaeicola saemankumensis]|nr:hypothetical protein [Seohaeicola saemankumensis]MCA0871918.1 hypothetical protein [Seohaeicola saemankumensis]